MRLKQSIDPWAFMKAVRSCRGEVWFETEAGDRLNLKSALSQFLFAAAQAKRLTESGTVRCLEVADYETLRDFLSA